MKLKKYIRAKDLSCGKSKSTRLSSRIKDTYVRAVSKIKGIGKSNVNTLTPSMENLIETKHKLIDMINYIQSPYVCDKRQEALIALYNDHLVRINKELKENYGLGINKI